MYTHTHTHIIYIYTHTQQQPDTFRGEAEAKWNLACAPAVRGGPDHLQTRTQRTKNHPSAYLWWVQAADPELAGVGGCSRLYEMFGLAGAICILSLAPVSSEEGESSL